MSFAENLKQIRKEKGLSQEELAELLDVSRQAVSKWEQGKGYPEVEKLLSLSQQLNVSLDGLLSTEIAQESNVKNAHVTGKVLISSPHENVIVSCYKVTSSQKFKGKKGSPQYALFGVSSGYGSFWGEPTTLLGWYANEEQITKEIANIQNAIMNGIPSYKLKYSVKVERHWFSLKIVND